MDGKNGRSTIVLIGGGAAWWASLICDVPQAIQNLAKVSPSWALHPDFLWSIFIIATTGVALYAVRSKPDTKAKEMPHDPLRMEYAIKFEREFNGWCRIGEWGLADANLAYQFLFVIAPDRIDFIGGDDAKKRYIAKIHEVHGHSAQVHTMFKMIKPWVHELICSSKESLINHESSLPEKPPPEIANAQTLPKLSPEEERKLKDILQQITDELIAIKAIPVKGQPKNAEPNLSVTATV